MYPSVWIPQQVIFGARVCHCLPFHLRPYSLRADILAAYFNKWICHNPAPVPRAAKINSVIEMSFRRLSQVRAQKRAAETQTREPQMWNYTAAHRLRWLCDWITDFSQKVERCILKIALHRCARANFISKSYFSNSQWGRIHRDWLKWHSFVVQGDSFLLSF